MSKHQTLDDLFHDTLKDIYYAERKILKALPKLRRAAQAETLKAAFQTHHDETENQLARLEKVFELIHKHPRGKTCDAIEGILAEGEEAIDEYKDTPALDAALIASAQAVEHYEISRYSTLRRWAVKLGLTEAAQLLGETLEEEVNTDGTLAGLADAALAEEAPAAA